MCIYGGFIVENKDEKIEQVVLRRSKDLVFRDVDNDLLVQFLDFANRHARGNKLYALRILLYNQKDSLIKRLEQIESKLEEHMTEGEEEPSRKVPKTMGGKNNE
jgi:transcriptional regulator of heat shock response